MILTIMLLRELLGSIVLHQRSIELALFIVDISKIFVASSKLVVIFAIVVFEENERFREKLQGFLQFP